MLLKVNYQFKSYSNPNLEIKSKSVLLMLEIKVNVSLPA